LLHEPRAVSEQIEGFGIQPITGLLKPDQKLDQGRIEIRSRCIQALGVAQPIRGNPGALAFRCYNRDPGIFE
jgi:hypothetical protein